MTIDFFLVKLQVRSNFCLVFHVFCVEYLVKSEWIFFMFYKNIASAGVSRPAIKLKKKIFDVMEMKIGRTWYLFRCCFVLTKVIKN